MRLLERDRSARFSTADATIEALLRCNHAPRDGRGELVQMLAERFPKEAKEAKEGTPEPDGAVIPESPPPPPGPGDDRITAPTLSEPSTGVASVLSSPPPARPADIAGRSHRGLVAATLWTAVVAGLAAVILLVRGEGDPAGTSSQDGRTIPDDRGPSPGSTRAPGRAEAAGARDGSALPIPSGGGAAKIATPDAGAVDAGAVDAGAVDAGAVDARAADARAVDARAVDARAADARAADARVADARAANARAANARAADARAADAGAADGTSAPAVVLVRRSPAGVSSGSRWPRREEDRVTRTGELAIIVSPWAVIWLNDKRRGQTPFREDVPAGRYRLRLTNDEVGQDEIMIVTVEPDRTETIERSW
jgi:hypothetical protein